MFKEYGALSTAVYNITKPIGKSLDGDLEFYLDQLTNVDGRILEAGVGTGRLLIPFAKEGYTIDGVDLSEDMLTQCLKNLNKHQVEAKIFQQDLLTLDLENKYNSIIMPTGSFCLISKEKILTLLKNFYDHLDLDGQLIFDIELPLDFKEQAHTTQLFTLSQNTSILFSSTSESIDWFDQKTSYLHRYELFEDGVLTQTELSQFTLYWYSIQEIIYALEKVGFTSIEWIRGYGINPDSSLLTFRAKK
ncbi:class I SAM-dependent DNA methyltransferase [Vagococcus silagei]|uniref:Class I SAM-dependent methyltransferase n=1 Tax=Vagococcus silagei TaxID=2508885 RepID=A0A4S3B5T6_9ENTE|nr:class I SAM-dependent methyltransferase [Vagococcus silagei]THB60836.1 class I SAM-dependent methyltransferase [Vagococcus silagei]